MKNPDFPLIFTPLVFPIRQEETFAHFLELVHPKLNYQHALTQQVRMVEPLREVQLQEGETKFLHPELQAVLDQASDIQQQLLGEICTCYGNVYKIRYTGNLSARKG